MPHPERIKAGTQIVKPALQPDPKRYDTAKRFVANDNNLGPGFMAFMPRLKVCTAGMTMVYAFLQWLPHE